MRWVNDIAYLIDGSLYVIILKDLIHFAIAAVDTLCIAFRFQYFRYIVHHCDCSIQLNLSQLCLFFRANFQWN